MLTLCFFKVILNKFFLQKTVVYSKFTSCSGCKFLGFFLPKYFHVLHLSSALSATCSRKKSGKGFLSKFGGFSALRPAIRANAHLNAALEMLRENRTFSARKCTRRCSSGGCGFIGAAYSNTTPRDLQTAAQRGHRPCSSALSECIQQRGHFVPFASVTATVRPG